MSVIIDAVDAGSPAEKAGLKGGDTLLRLNGNEIMDVLDYRFYQDNTKLRLQYIDSSGKQKSVKIKKGEYDELGLRFSTYLMDKQHACRNKCVFCFIDQLPRGLRESLYFKDDDSRLSFLFGNYITLTNITEHEIARIIKMHISPINISVHTTNPALRVRMMTNKNAGNVLGIMNRLNDAGIKINCQLVLCPGYNDGAELERTLSDLIQLENAECIAVVPVGLTRYREGLTKLEPFCRQTAEDVLTIIDAYGESCLRKYGQRRIYAADEFYLLAERELPQADYYGDFLQLENGVGLWSLLRSEALSTLETLENSITSPRKISMATGEAAYPLIKMLAEKCMAKNPLLNVRVFGVKNNFFGGKINVSGLVTATDIIEQLEQEELGDELLIPAVMLRQEGDMFLDSITVDQLSERLHIKVTPVQNDGDELIRAILGIEE